MKKYLVRKSYKEFSQAEGNQHIASEYAIFKLLELTQKFNVKNVLEIGLGIGSIAGTLLAMNKHLNYTGTEANEFCLNALPQNLEEEYHRLKIFNDLSAVPIENIFDLIIIDGKDENLEQVRKLISKNGILAIEGDRMPQQERLQELFPQSKCVHSISANKNKPYCPFPKNHWQGGLKIIFVNPTASQSWCGLKEKIGMKFKYFYRNCISL